MSPPDEVLDEKGFWEKLQHLPKKSGAALVSKALTLYVILTDGKTPVWVRVLVLTALAYLINPFDAVPDAIPVAGFTDDLAVLALALERLSHFIPPEVEVRVREMLPWVCDEQKPVTFSIKNQKKGKSGHDETGNQETDQGKVPRIERHRLL